MEHKDKKDLNSGFITVKLTHGRVAYSDRPDAKYEIALNTSNFAMVYLLDLSKMIELRNALNDRINGCKNE